MNIHTISTLKRITPASLHQKLLAQLGHNGSNKTATISPTIAIIDVRDADHVGGHIRSSRHIPSSTFTLALPALLEQLCETETVVFHCALSTQRGPAAALAYLRAKGEMEEEDAKKKKRESRERMEDEDEREIVVQKKGRRQGQEVLLLDGGFTQWQQL